MSTNPTSPQRRRFEWRLPNQAITLGDRTLVLGVLNVTPDSFSDGGDWLQVEAAIARGLEMLDQGAAILDIGGESTRPGARPTPPIEEQGRILPVIRGILRARPDAVLSVDTYRAETARVALRAGAQIINDVSGGLWDPGMASAWASERCGVILMHTRGRPDEWAAQPRRAPDELVPATLAELRTRIETAEAAGVAPEAIAVDPGFGFGKVLEENFTLLAALTQFAALGYPLAVGLSRKGFLRHAIGDSAASSPLSAASEAVRDATIAGNVAAILAGAHLIRVHDVVAARHAAAVADRVLSHDFGGY